MEPKRKKFLQELLAKKQRRKGRKAKAEGKLKSLKNKKGGTTGTGGSWW